MKVFHIGIVGKSITTLRLIQQFDDVKVWRLVTPVAELKKDINGNPVAEEWDFGWALPSGEVPVDPENWQSSPDPVLQEGEVFMKRDKPEGDFWIVTADGDWELDREAVVARNKQIVAEGLRKAADELAAIDDEIEFNGDTPELQAKRQAWREFRVNLRNVDVNQEHMVVPAVPE